MKPKTKHFAVYAFIIAAGFFCAWLFLPKKENPAPAAVPEAPPETPKVQTVLLSEFNDMESYPGLAEDEKAFSGKKSFVLSPAVEYGLSAVKFMRDIPSFQNLNSIIVRYKCFMNEDPDALFVLSIDDASGKNLFWAADSIACEKGKWADAVSEFRIAPELLKADNKISLYPWNRNKKEFRVDDIRIDYSGAMEMQKDAAVQGNRNLFFDMESTEGMNGTDAIKVTTAHSGSKACSLTGGQEYGPTVSRKLAELKPFPAKISMSMWVFPLSDNVNTVLTASVSNPRNEAVFWDGESTENRPFPKNKWTKLNTSFFLPLEKLGAEDVLTVNIWNKGKTDVIVDDLEIVYGDPAERRGEPSPIDPNTIYNKSFRQQANKPPFPVIWLEKQETGKESGLDQFHPGDLFLAGDLAEGKEKLDEVLCIAENRQALFAYDPAQKQFQKLWDNSNAADSLFNGNNSYALVEQGNDHRTALLLTDKKTGSWGIINFTGGKGRAWKILAKGAARDKVPARVIVRDNYMENQVSYSGGFTADKPQFLKLDQQWRFDLKLTEGDNILGSVDFKGYPADHNPKYYEFVRLVNGHFTNASRNSLLVIMANCADADFNGSQCHSLENLPYLPNCTQLYCFPE
jgi:hypothetical protein